MVVWIVALSKQHLQQLLVFCFALWPTLWSCSLYLLECYRIRLFAVYPAQFSLLARTFHFAQCDSFPCGRLLFRLAQYDTMWLHHSVYSGWSIVRIQRFDRKYYDICNSLGDYSVHLKCHPMLCQLHWPTSFHIILLIRYMRELGMCIRWPFLTKIKKKQKTHTITYH